MSLQATPVGDEEANILTSHHLHANIINIPETNEEFNYKQYPYTYRRTKNGNGLFASITQWMFKSIVYGVCFILLSPLLIPLYLIVIIHWQYNLISNRNELKKEESIKPLLIKCFHITVITMLTLMSLYLGPILWFIYNDRPKISLIASRFSWVSILLFCLFRESIVLRLARWHVRDKNIVTLQYIQRHCPQWFLKWFIRNLYLHKLLIKYVLSIYFNVYIIYILIILFQGL